MEDWRTQKESFGGILGISSKNSEDFEFVSS